MKNTKSYESENKSSPRQNWSEAFRQMHENGDDELLIPDVFEDEEFEEFQESETPPASTL